jgi:outer membrane lipoprotein-sorting protein
MAGKRRAAYLAALLCGLIALAPAAIAQPVPLPLPAPQPKDRTPPVAAPQARPAPAQESGVPNWFPPIFGGKPSAGPSAPAGTVGNFTAAQRALVDKVSAYLSSVQVLSGDFTQIGPDGRQTHGQFYLAKPGRVRFEYAPPTPIDIVADGSSVVVRDRKLATQDVYPLSQTPLRFLLSDHIDLLRDTNVVGVYSDELYATVVVEENQLIVGTSRLMMQFGAKDLQLKQWTITDPQGYDTTVAVSKLDNKSRPDPNMFKIDYTNYTR